MELILILGALAVAIAIIAVKEDARRKKELEGFNLFAIDRDNDGLVQEGTKWERPVKKAPKKKAAKKKAPAKKAAKKAVKKAPKKAAKKAAVKKKPKTKKKKRASVTK